MILRRYVAGHQAYFPIFGTETAVEREELYRFTLVYLSCEGTMA
jgi:hypothetical protein